MRIKGKKRERERAPRKAWEGKREKKKIIGDLLYTILEKGMVL